MARDLTLKMMINYYLQELLLLLLLLLYYVITGYIISQPLAGRNV